MGWWEKIEGLIFRFTIVGCRKGSVGEKVD